MMIVDTALAARAAAHNPVRFGVYGAGFMGRGLANQVLNYMPGLHLAVICNRTVAAALAAYTAAASGTAIALPTPDCAALLTELE